MPLHAKSPSQVLAGVSAAFDVETSACAADEGSCSLPFSFSFKPQMTKTQQTYKTITKAIHNIQQLHKMSKQSQKQYTIITTHGKHNSNKYQNNYQHNTNNTDNNINTCQHINQNHTNIEKTTTTTQSTKQSPTQCKTYSNFITCQKNHKHKQNNIHKYMNTATSTKHQSQNAKLKENT